MDDSKTVVRTVRFSPATWAKLQKKSELLGVPASKLVELAARALLGEPISERYKVTAEAFSGR